MERIYKNFWFDLICAVVALLLGVVMLPVFGIVTIVLNALLAATLVGYLVVFMIDKLRRTRGLIFVLAVIEFIVMVLIIAELLVEQFNPLRTAGICQTIGLVLWLRGVVMVIGMYSAALSVRKPQDKMSRFIIGVVLISGGMYLFTNPIIPNAVMEWVLCISLFLFALIFAGLAYLFSPTKPAAQGKKK